MSADDFVHLHVHSHLSLLEGACQFAPLLDAAAAAGQKAMALTDHGNLFGAVSFYKAARQRGIKPILGMEAYLAAGSRHEKKRAIQPGRRRNTYRLTLLARDLRGFENLVRLSSLGYTEGFYYKPRIDKAALREHGAGLIALTGTVSGEIPQAILHGGLDEAEGLVREYREIFGADGLWLEVMNHGLEDEDRVREGLIALSGRTGVPLVATNDIHYVQPEDWKVQDVALCIGSGKLEADPDRFRMHSQELYFKTGEAMTALFADCPEAVSNTKVVADLCEVELPLGARHLPSFTPPEGLDSETYFRRLCREGVERLYDEITPEIEERLAYETDVIVQMGFVDYFLITWDFIDHARKKGIPVGPGRGSAAGSIVAYSLGITQLDPIKYDLLFERFLNSQRVSMPDIDIDFCKDRREEVIRYVEDKYGREQVAQIITFGTMKARAVIRDVGRVMDVPLGEVDRIAKKIPSGPKDTLAQALETDTEVQELYRASETNKRLFDIALRLEGNARHASIHAAGLVVSDRPLVERVPLYRSGEDVTTQWTMDVLEEVGLLKMDFLGLRTLTIIHEAVRNVARTRGLTLDMEQIPLDDAATYEMLQRGDSTGVFQLESEGMKDLLRRMKPDRFDDLIAVLALYRPGPLGSGMVDTYVARKHGRERIEYPHPSLEPILEESLGVILYQEQVMRIASTMSGFSLNEADNLRKAMGKKKPEILAKFKKQFVDGAIANGIASKTAEEVFDLIEYFAGYGFNKSHSAAYALVTYQTAWLKANHPVEFMAGLLTCEMIQIEKTVEYTEECRAMGIEILPPDVNHSFPKFAVEDGKIRFALAAIKGVGTAAVEDLVRAREEGDAFRTLFDLCERIDSQKANRSTMEALNWAGAMDSLEGNRAQRLAVLDDALAMGSAADRDRRSGQGSLFGGDDMLEELKEAERALMPDIPEVAEQDRLQKEKDVLGFYLTGHPLNRVRDEIRRFSTSEISRLRGLEDGTKVSIGGIICGVRAVTIRNGPRAGQKMAIIRFEDFTGTIEAVIFSDLYLQLIDRLREDKICFLKGEVDRRRDEPGLRVSEVIELDDARCQLTQKVTLRVEAGEELEMVIPALRRILKSHAGAQPVFFDLRTPDFGSVIIKAGPSYSVAISPPLLEELEKVLGTERVGLN